MTFEMASGGIRVAGEDGLAISWSLVSSLVTTPGGSMKVSFKPSSGLKGTAEVYGCGSEEAVRQLRLAGYRVEQTKVHGDQVMIAIMGEEHLP